MVFEGTYFYKLMDEPLVFVVWTGWVFPTGLSVCLQEAQGRPCRVLVQCGAYGPYLVDRIVDFKENADPQYRHMLLTYLCNTQADADVLNSKGVDALFVHHNAFIDERVYRVIPGAEKKYSAVHNANTNVTNFKRHHLAWGVGRIALITYAAEHLDSVEEISGYKDLAFVNKGADGRSEFLSGNAVTKIVNESRCGLILSAIEGGNHSSSEYLFCGIPVVSTPSLGGRDEFFDPRHVKIVDPTPEAVEKAVAEWGEHAPPPEEIRASALKKARIFRARLLHWLSAMSGQDQFATADENLWSPLFVDKLRTWVTIPPFKIPDIDDPTIPGSQDPPKRVVEVNSPSRIHQLVGKLSKSIRSSPAP